MKLHEYQAKELFRQYGVSAPAGGVASSVAEAEGVAARLGRWPLVVKAQVLAGGRGKGGGVRLAADGDELRRAAADILGMTLVTKQTAGAGRLVRKILVEEGVGIGRELYLALLPDRASAGLMLVASAAGGADIEEVAAATPEAIVRVPVNPLAGLAARHVRAIALGLGLGAELQKQMAPLLAALYRLCTERDATLVEINPLAVTADGRLLALDAKVEIDDNALFRQPALAGQRDTSEDDPLERQAAECGLNYIKLDGTVGNMVNGAGLAMATMDLIEASGASPANFLDVGGGASAEMVENGFRIILADPNVRGIFINIFGGILRCDVLARGVVEAARKTNIPVPVVVRMEGTNVEEGRRILAESGLDLATAVDLADAARKVAALAG